MNASGRTWRREKLLIVSVALVAMALGSRYAEGAGTNSAERSARNAGLLSRLAEPKQVEEQYVNFSFDQVNVRSFVKLVGEITGKRFVVDEEVQGKLTVAAGNIERKEVYAIFLSILESVGCSVVRDGDLYRVVALPERGTTPGLVVGPEEETPAGGVITKVFRLAYVSAGELSRVLESQVGGGKDGGIAAVEETNHLIITDTASNVRRFERMIEEIDKPGLARRTEVVVLKFAGAEDLAQQLNRAVAEEESRGDRLKRRLTSVGGESERHAPVIVASPHSNSLLLVGSASQVAQLRQIIAKMDVDAPAGRGRLNAIFLKYLSATEAAESINALLKKTSEKSETGPVRGNIAIEASEANNALLVDGSPSDFEMVKRLVDQLDHAPQQVHISVMIAEVSLSDELSFGVEMAALDMPGDGDTMVLQGSSRFKESADTLMSAIQGGIFPKGITVGVASGTRVGSDGEIVANLPGIINIDALRRDGKFKVLSETSLESQNNREASVSIVNEIPILESTVEGAGVSRDVVRNIKRMDVGIKLKLTPHVIATNEVRVVLNPSIEAVIDPGPSGTQFAPTIAKREVATTVTVPNGETIVIAGLTREDETTIKKKIPILGSIPLLGLLFRQEQKVNEKTNLLIFVTPRIVTESLAAQALVEEWREKTGLKEKDEE